MKYAIILGLSLLGMLAVGCAGSGYAAPKPDLTSIGLAGPARGNCNEIMGTPFRSAEERQWFEENCSKWPPTNFADLASVRAKEPAECAGLRGKLYASATERQWFQSNCTGNSSAPDPAVFAGASPANCQPGASTTPLSNNGRGRQASPTPTALTGCTPGSPGASAYDRTDCNQIRESAVFYTTTEREWYVKNCSGWQQAPASTTTPRQLAPQYQYCNPTHPGQPNARGRSTPPC